MEILFTDVAEYAEAIATSHVDIVHTEDAPRFFRSWDEFMELKSKVKKLAGKAILIIDEPAIKGMGANNDNNLRERNIQFFVLKPAYKKDFVEIDSIADACEKIQNEIIGKMRKDKEDFTNDNILSDFNPNDYTGERVGPLADNWYGYVFEHRFISNVDLEYNAAKWQ